MTDLKQTAEMIRSKTEGMDDATFIATILHQHHSAHCLDMWPPLSLRPTHRRNPPLPTATTQCAAGDLPPPLRRLRRELPLPLYACHYGRFRLARITKVSEAFIRCGDYRYGVARLQCSNPECHGELFRPFAC